MNGTATMNSRSSVGIIRLLVVFGAFVSLYYGVAYNMALHWSADPNYSHGFLIPLISAYLLWERRDLLRTVEVRPSNWGVVVLLFGLLMLVMGSVGAELFTMRVSMLVVMAGLVIFLGGFNVLRAVALPLGYLIFMIPLPYIVYDAIAFPLKLFAAHNAVAFLKLVGIPVYREGNVIHLAQTTLEVADACSGIRSLISLIALGVALAYFAQKGWARRVIVVFMAVPIAILVNVTRVVVTGVLAHYYGAEVATGFFHEFSGFLMFGVAMAMLVALNLAVSWAWKIGAAGLKGGE